MGGKGGRGKGGRRGKKGGTGRDGTGHLPHGRLQTLAALYHFLRVQGYLLVRIRGRIVYYVVKFKPL